MLVRRLVDARWTLRRTPTLAQSLSFCDEKFVGKEHKLPPSKGGWKQLNVIYSCVRVSQVADLLASACLLGTTSRRCLALVVLVHQVLSVVDCEARGNGRCRNGHGNGGEPQGCNNDFSKVTAPITRVCSLRQIREAMERGDFDNLEVCERL